MIVALDASATHYTQNLSEPELGRIHHESNTEHKILYVSPYILLALDVFFLIAYGTSVITCCALIKYGDRGYYCLLLTICVPMASILLHLPYIAIAYLNDANHAGSVLILYTVVTFLEFIILQFIFIQWFNLEPVNSEISRPPQCGTQAARSDGQERQGSLPQDGTPAQSPVAPSQSQSQSRPSSRQSGSTTIIANHSEGIELSSIAGDAQDPVCTQRKTKRESRFSLRRFVCFGLIVFSSLLSLYCIVGICVSFFYYLPINHSISSTSNQIIIVYQTGLVFVGAIVAYKTIFKKRDKFVEALDECEDKVKDSLLNKEKNVNWVASTDQEKLNIFYRHVITYIILNLIREAQDNETSGTPDNE